MYNIHLKLKFNISIELFQCNQIMIGSTKRETIYRNFCFYNSNPFKNIWTGSYYNSRISSRKRKHFKLCYEKTNISQNINFYMFIETIFFNK